MTRYEFKSVFAEEIQNYIKDKVATGFDSNSFRSSLIRFDRFCVEQDIKEPVLLPSMHPDG